MMRDGSARSLKTKIFKACDSFWATSRIGKLCLSALESSGAEHVIHLAGLQVPTCKANPVAGAMVNVIGTLNLFEAAKSLGINGVVYASSAAVYGMNDDDVPVDESAVCEPSTHYGVFKRANEGNARIYFLDHGVSSVGLRPLTVYGVNRDTGLTSDPTKAMKAAVLERPFHIRFGGATDFQYAADTAAAFIACADQLPDGASVFNLHGETVAVVRGRGKSLINMRQGNSSLSADLRFRLRQQ
jgi:nucleoside-diphosphate-sugar epimerase